MSTIFRQELPRGRAFAPLAVAALLCAAGFAASGCNNAAEGGLSGAALGAGLGAVIGSYTGSAGAGAVIGAAAGGLGGAVLGDQNERRERHSRRYDY